MTEDEAKTKWCPKAMVPMRSGDSSRNRGLTGNGDTFLPEGTLCIASECMAWRETSTQHGYCGIAGRPRA